MYVYKRQWRKGVEVTVTPFVSFIQPQRKLVYKSWLTHKQIFDYCSHTGICVHVRCFHNKSFDACCSALICILRLFCYSLFKKMFFATLRSFFYVKYTWQPISWDVIGTNILKRIHGLWGNYNHANIWQ